MNAAPHRAEAHSKRSAAELQLLSPSRNSTSGPKINIIKSPPRLSPDPAPAARARHQSFWPRGAVLGDTARAGASPVRQDGGDRDRGRDWGRRQAKAAPRSPFSAPPGWGGPQVSARPVGGARGGERRARAVAAGSRRSLPARLRLSLSSLPGTAPGTRLRAGG